MWMQKSVDGMTSSGNFHDRNRISSSNSFGGSYNGNSQVHQDTGDWKSKILESGQWLGGKVIEYGGKLARGSTTESLPDHYAHQMPRNDGRANWMADIRSSSSSSFAVDSHSRPYTGGYQNDFVTERPNTYSDYSTKNVNNGFGSNGYEVKRGHGMEEPRPDQDKQCPVKKKSKKKKQKKKKKKETSDSERDESSMSDSSEGNVVDERRHQSKEKKKKPHKIKKSQDFYSEESESNDENETRKPSADYAFSFGPSKLPPPRAKDVKKVTTKKSKTKKTKTDKASKKSRSRRHSVTSEDDESAAEKQNTHKAKRSSKKAASSSSASVDLLGVDLDVEAVVQFGSSGRPVRNIQPSIFDAPQSQDPLQDLAGLTFVAPVQVAASSQPSVNDSSVLSAPSNETQPHSQPQSIAFQTSLLPENNIVDLSSLAKEKKKPLSANPNEKRTLNDMQKARGVDPPTPVMALPIHGQQPQNMSGCLMQLNLNQLQITDGSTGMQQSNMLMQQMPMQLQMPSHMVMPQPQMTMMVQPQTMNMQMLPMQQFAQGNAAMAQSTGATSPKSLDPFHTVVI